MRSVKERRRITSACIHDTDRGSQGGLDRTSQHPAEGGCDDDRQTRIRTINEGQIALAGAARSGATIGAAPFLVLDCLRPRQRGSCSQDRYLAAGWNSVVSRGWRYALFTSGPIRAFAIPALPMLGKTRRVRSAFGAEHRLARDCTPLGPRALDHLAADPSQRRHTFRRFGCRATMAQWHAERSAKRAKTAKLATNAALRHYVQDRLSGHISYPGGLDSVGPQTVWKGRRHGRRQPR